jgi:transcriptional regulator with GAF, ATPase, and Fis domain
MTAQESVAAPFPGPLVDAFTSIAEHLHASDDVEASFRRITSAAVHALVGCEAASVSVLEKTGPVTHAATSPLADLGDQIQYAENEGPCLDAAMEERWVYTPDLAVDTRWPRSARRMSRELGVKSMLSCRLTMEAAPRRTLGGINLYATDLNAFTEDDQSLAVLLASLGAVVVDASRQQAGLRAAIESRQVIGEAIGILRSQGNLTSEQAFDMLAKASQRMNVKLRELAGRIADGSHTGRGL